MINFIKRLLLLIIFGKQYDYMARSVMFDNRVKTAKLVDIVVRKDGIERRIEADWIKNLAKIVSTSKRENESIAYNKKYGHYFPKDISRPILCENCTIIKNIIE